MPFFPDQNGKVYEMLLANLPVMLHCMDGQGRITSVNKHWAAVLGYTPKRCRASVQRVPVGGIARPAGAGYLSQLISSRALPRAELMTMIRRDGIGRARCCCR